MFSIVVPVWNKRQFLRRTIEHVLVQTFDCFELILVDDGSTDGSLATLAGIEDPRMRIVAQSNAGPGVARNHGIAEARHDWVAFLDADDLWLPEHLAELDRIRTAFPTAGLIGTRFVTSDRRRVHLPYAGQGVVERVCFFDRVGRGEPMLSASSAAAPTALLCRLGGFSRVPRGEDSELWARIALDYPVARSTRVTAVYIRGTNGITETMPTAWGSGVPRRLEDLSPALAVVLERLPRVSAPEVHAAIERFVERYLDWTLRSAVIRRDISTQRALPDLYRRLPPFQHRIVFAVARLPAPLAILIARTLLGAEALGLRLSARWQALSSVKGFVQAATRPFRSEA